MVNSANRVNTDRRSGRQLGIVKATACKRPIPGTEATVLQRVSHCLIHSLVDSTHVCDNIRVHGLVEFALQLFCCLGAYLMIAVHHRRELGLGARLLNQQLWDGCREIRHSDRCNKEGIYRRDKGKTPGGQTKDFKVVYSGLISKLEGGLVKPQCGVMIVNGISAHYHDVC